MKFLRILYKVIMGVMLGIIVMLAVLIIGNLDLIFGLMIGGAVGFTTACLSNVSNDKEDDD